MNRIHTIFCLALITIAQCAVADCTGTLRPATKAEMDFELKVKAAIHGVLPPAASGWAVQRDDEVSAADTVCVIEEPEKLVPIHVELGRGYAQTEVNEERQRALADAFQQSMASPQAAKIQELNESMYANLQKFEEPMQKAAARNDVNEMVRVSEEMERVTQEAKRQIDALQEEIDKATLALTEKYLPRDTTAEIIVHVNYAPGLYAPESNEGVKPVAVAGAAAAFRSQGERVGTDGWNEGVTTIFLGNWRVAAKAGSPPDVQAALNKSAPHTKAQVLAIQIRADEQRADQLLRQINLPALEALLK